MRPVLTQLVLVCLVVGGILSGPAAAAGPEFPSDPRVQKAVEAWLAKLDSGAYRACWEQGSEVLKKNTTLAQWEAALTEANKRLGPTKSRALSRSKQERNPQGPPPGEYAFLEYAAKHESIEAKEILILRLENGAWRVAGYMLQ
jgi:hypothetical protein